MQDTYLNDEANNNGLVLACTEWIGMAEEDALVAALVIGTYGGLVGFIVSRKAAGSGAGGATEALLAGEPEGPGQEAVEDGGPGAVAAKLRS